MAQHALVAQVIPAAYLAFQINFGPVEPTQLQVPKLAKQTIEPTIELGIFLPHFFPDLTRPGSITPIVHYTSTVYGDAYHLSFSIQNEEHHMSWQDTYLTSALTHQTILVRQFLEHIKAQCITDEVS